MLTMTNAVGRTWTYATTPQQSVSSTPLGNTTTSTRTSYGLPGESFAMGSLPPLQPRGFIEVLDGH